jgi:hypothetical protein
MDVVNSTFTYNNNFDTLLINLKKELDCDTFNLPIILDNINNNYRNKTMYSSNHMVSDNLIIKIGDNALSLNKSEFTYSNPFSNSKLPLAYSIIYKRHLITLFEPGKFQCLKIPQLQRDQKFESILNTKTFDYCLLIDDKLIASNNDQYFQFNGDQKWEPYKKEIYAKKSPKLFENKNFISFSACHGEFGGQLFFIEKSTNKTYYLPSTCPVSIVYRDKKYYITSSLGHMFGHANIFTLSNPSELIAFEGNLNKVIKEGISYDDFHPPKLNTKLDTVFNSRSLQIFSTFFWQDKILSLVHWCNITFIAECSKNEIRIVNSLFNNNLYTHQPVTTQYDKDLVLINMDFYGIGREKEVACILLDKNKLIKINWTDKVKKNEKIR